MAEPTLKCSHCGGFALEPEVFPAQPCTVCKGTGKPAAAAKTGELIDG
ncbi:MAG TPA: hypothetical protein VF680_11530 [Allosphingosinicella sp.]|jgi:DnaJ-class molecular chaperone